jgi:hypothetical protein
MLAGTFPTMFPSHTGYGYNGRVGQKCEQGTYNGADNYNTCMRCPRGTTTAGPGAGKSPADCKVAPGFSAAGECPIGTYQDSLGGNASFPATCTPCPAGQTTMVAGASSVADCQCKWRAHRMLFCCRCIAIRWPEFPAVFPCMPCTLQTVLPAGEVPTAPRSVVAAASTQPMAVWGAACSAQTACRALMLARPSLSPSTGSRRMTPSHLVWSHALELPAP